MSEVGYCKPPKHSQFKPGQSGNPGGLSKERRRLIDESAEMAARILHRQLKAVVDAMGDDAEGQHIIEGINADVHRIVKDALDRADGTARQSVDLSASVGLTVNIQGNDADL